MPKKATTKKILSHVPALDPDRLKLAMLNIDALNLPAPARGLLKDILASAANPNAERPDVVINTLPHQRRENVMATRSALTQQAGTVERRGAQALRALSDSEWLELVEGDA